MDNLIGAKKLLIKAAHRRYKNFLPQRAKYFCTAHKTIFSYKLMYGKWNMKMYKGVTSNKAVRVLKTHEDRSLLKKENFITFIYSTGLGVAAI
jgi:hypothetical protein